MTFTAGQRVSARTSANRLIAKRAVTPVVKGADFDIVWVCGEKEWEAAEREGRKANATPWPASAVQPLSD
jgi:hypothetical protein